MKTLKLKSILCSLMAIAMVTVFLSSCEKNPIETFDETESIVVQEEMQIFLPRSVDIKNEDSIKDFIDNATMSELEQLQKDAIIYEHLLEHDKIEEITKNYGYAFESYSAVDYTNYLSDVELENLNSKLQKDDIIRSRGCFYINICTTHHQWCNTSTSCYVCGTYQTCSKKRVCI